MTDSYFFKSIEKYKYLPETESLQRQGDGHADLRRPSQQHGPRRRLAQRGARQEVLRGHGLQQDRQLPLQRAGVVSPVRCRPPEAAAVPADEPHLLHTAACAAAHAVRRPQRRGECGVQLWKVPESDARSVVWTMAGAKRETD